MLKNRRWFAKGGRHGLENRISDLWPILGSFDASRMTALDAGAAEGDISVWLSGYFRHVTAIELMELAFAALQERISIHRTITAVHADIASWPVPMRYDCVFLLGVLHYFEEDDAKQLLLSKYLAAARYGLFARTGIRERKLRAGVAPAMTAKYTPLSLLDCVSGHEFDYGIIDNSYRGTGELRLGDLIVFRRRCVDNPLPPIASIVAPAD